MQLQDSVALVTGGLSGLGRATALKLAAQAKHVVVLDLPREDGDETAAAIGANVRYAPADVTSSEEVADVMERVRELGQLRVLVNCAGVATPGKVLGREGGLPLERFSKVLEINVNGTFNVIRLAAEAMAHSEAEVDEHGTSERGVIINTASVAAFDGQIGQPAYAASKGIDLASTDFDPERFVDFYAQKGWMVGKSRMKDWKASVRNWVRTSKPIRETKQEVSEGDDFSQYD